METGNKIIVVVNLDVFNTQGAHIKLPLEKLQVRYDKPYQITDLLSGSVYQWTGDYNYVQLNPYQMPAHIFKIDKL